MSEAVTVPSFIMITSIVSEESLARDTHTHTLGVVYLKLVHSKIVKTKAGE